MTEQQNYGVVADRDNGDDPMPSQIETGDRVTFEVDWADGKSWDGYPVRIERPVPTTDEPRRVLMTHPHDGHGPDDTCLDCETKPSPHPPTREQIAEATALIEEADGALAVIGDGDWTWQDTMLRRLADHYRDLLALSRTEPTDEWEAEDSAPQVLREIAERDPVGHGQRLARAYGVGPVAEPTIPVPVSLIEEVLADMGSAAEERLRALLSQPTPTAEKPHAPSCDGWMQDEGDCTCGVAAPPNIADMVPGSEFLCEGKGVPGVAHHMRVTEDFYRDGARILWCLTHEFGATATYVDPSTIRDVSSPER